MSGENKNVAPWPTELVEIVDVMAYRPGWAFHLGEMDRGQGSEGLTFVVTSLGYDTYHPDRGETYRVNHYFPVPPASYNRESWRRWVLDRLVEIETHEACEFFRLVDPEDTAEGVAFVRPFAPNHGPGWDPYQIRELNTVEDAETSFQGERDEGSQG